jgi:FkbM family methyltransferase
MLSRDSIKNKLQQFGLFPIARSAYRRISREVRDQKRQELLFYGDLIRKQSLCFDIGANLGQRSEILYELGNRVVLVEPNANCKSTLEFLFSKNPDVVIVEKAVGSAEGEIEFHAHGTDSTASTDPDWDKKVFGSDRGQAVQKVPITTMDALILQYGKPDFAKIDVEGFEVEVLRGLSHAIPLLSFEFHAEHMTDAEICLDLLKRHGDISVRACNMDCEWLMGKSRDTESALNDLKSMDAKGDLFVWTSTR